MKKNALLVAMMLCTILAFSQSTNLIFFTEEGEKFSVILNGVLQNETPETNVKVTDLISPSYKLKIIFKDSSLASLDKNLMFNQGTETTFDIKKNNKGEYVVRYMNEVPIAQAPLPPSGQKVVVFTTTGPAAPIATTTVSTTQTTTTTNGASDNVSMGVNIGGTGFNMNVNMNDGNGGMNSSSSTSTTYTTTTTTTTTGVAVQPSQPQQQVYVMPGYSGPTGCPWPMSDADFADAKNSISSKSFEDSKLSIAKQVFTSNCLLSSQVKEIMSLFSFEDTKLDFAKFAYGRTFDTGNYFKVNDAFTFESSIDALNTYISSYTR